MVFGLLYGTQCTIPMEMLLSLPFQLIFTLPKGRERSVYITRIIANDENLHTSTRDMKLFYCVKYPLSMRASLTAIHQRKQHKNAWHCLANIYLDETVPCRKWEKNTNVMKEKGGDERDGNVKDPQKMTNSSRLFFRYEHGNSSPETTIFECLCVCVCSIHYTYTFMK